MSGNSKNRSSFVFIAAALAIGVLVYFTAPSILTFLAYMQESSKSKAPIPPTTMVARPEGLTLGGVAEPPKSESESENKAP